MAESFRELKIWQKGYELLEMIYEITSAYPQEEKFCLIQATRRSANSIIANIAESQGRFYYLDKIRVLYIARGELSEVRSHLHVARGQDYLSHDKFDHVDNEYQGLCIGINNYIKFLATEKASQSSLN
jgi:four helix bundle protein